MSNTSYVVLLSSATLPDASVATTVTLYIPAALSAFIMPSHVPLTSVSATSSAVTLNTPAASVATTVTLIDSFGTTLVRSIATEVISGSVVSSTSYVVSSFLATLSNVSIATMVTSCTPYVLLAFITPSQVPLLSASATPLAVTLNTPAASVAITSTLIVSFGSTSTGSSTTEVITGGIVSARSMLYTKPP